MVTQMPRPVADIDHLVTAQMQEMEMVRQKVYSLEQTQLAIKQRYDEPDKFFMPLLVLRLFSP